ncbi:MAG: hypothetical protein COA67_04855 [Lutibacter sp.]|nr:MAG: hypothetical protein COA67_04855 [Lutibacter sp.]
MLLPILSFAQEDKTNDFDTFQKAGNTPIRINFKPGHIGTPYLYNNWKTGYVIINDSIISSQKKIQFNQETGELIIGSKNQNGIVITDKSVTGFAIDKGDNITSINRHVFAKINSAQFENSNGTSAFYEVVSNLEQTNYLIKDVKKYLFDPNKSRGYQTQNSIPQEYKEKVSYFVKNKSGKYIKTKLRKKNVLKILNDKNSEVNAFILSNKINFSKEHDVVRVLNYYHKL